MARSNNGMSYLDKVRLNQAQLSYERAVAKTCMHKHSASVKYYEAAEKRALVNFMSLAARCGGSR